MVTVSKNVVISGIPDANGDMPTIEGGNRPFFVDAGNASVSIQKLNFIRPASNAIFVYSAGGLTVAGCVIESVQPTIEFGMEAGQANPLAGAIFVGADPVPPNSTTHPGKPENFSGVLAVVNNDIDVGALPGTHTHVSGNNIRNVSEPAINLRVVGGRISVERNLVTTGAVATASSDAIRIVGSGSYLIAHNRIDCGWADGTVTGINVLGQAPPMVPVTDAVIVDNDVSMSAPDGTVFAANSAGIEIRCFAQGHSVLNNRIRGRARAAVSLIDQNAGMPAGNSFVSNDVGSFQSSLADIFIDAGVANTIIIGGQANVEDHGVGTTVVLKP
jgi:hypothetical protein